MGKTHKTFFVIGFLIWILRTFRPEQNEAE